jgi:transposase
VAEVAPDQVKTSGSLRAIFDNRRELAALVGLVPAPYQSGETQHDEGITRAGNTHVRRIMVQLAWGWLRFQPQSALTQWYQRRFSSGKRLRRIGIVALARKLLVSRAVAVFGDRGNPRGRGAEVYAGLTSRARRCRAQRRLSKLVRAPVARGGFT